MRVEQVVCPVAVPKDVDAPCVVCCHITSNICDDVGPVEYMGGSYAVNGLVMADTVRAVCVGCLFGPVGEVNKLVTSVVPEQLIAAAVIGADSRRAVILRGIGPVQRAQLVPVGIVAIDSFSYRFLEFTYRAISFLQRTARCFLWPLSHFPILFHFR